MYCPEESCSQVSPYGVVYGAVPLRAAIDEEFMMQVLRKRVAYRAWNEE